MLQDMLRELCYNKYALSKVEEYLKNTTLDSNFYRVWQDIADYIRIKLMKNIGYSQTEIVDIMGDKILKTQSQQVYLEQLTLEQIYKIAEASKIK